MFFKEIIFFDNIGSVTGGSPLKLVFSHLIWNSNRTVVFKWTTEDIWMIHLSTHIVVEYNTLKAKLWFSCRSSLCLKCDVELVIWYEIPYNLREKFGSVSNIGLFDWVNINNYILLLSQHHCPHCIEC